MKYTAESLELTTIPVKIYGYKLTLTGEDGTRRTITFGPKYKSLERILYFYDGMRSKVGTEDLPEDLKHVELMEQDDVLYQVIKDKDSPQGVMYTFGRPEDIARVQRQIKAGNYIFAEYDNVVICD